MRIISIFLIGLGFLAACTSSKEKKEDEERRVDVDALKTNMNDAPGQERGKVVADDYWRQGKAELNHYELIQNRYRDLHDGEAVLIFVLEDFLYEEQVKNDNYRNPNSTPILKTNKILRFPTGLYDYSLMTSVFTPVDSLAFPHTLKVSHSAQDWCGQGWLQMNRRDKGYKLSSYSYFESEGDEFLEVKNEWLEDELYNRIRLAPSTLPEGKVSMIPSSDVVRLLHLPLKAQEAMVSVEDYEGSDFVGEKLKSLKVNYPKLKRDLMIVFSAEKPYEIVGWKDTYPSVFDRKPRTTFARRTDKLFTDYWSKNARGDQGLRAKFGLETYVE